MRSKPTVGASEARDALAVKFAFHVIDSARSSTPAKLLLIPAELSEAQREPYLKAVRPEPVEGEGDIGLID